MANVTIGNLPAAGALSGAELLPLLQSAVTKQTSISALLQTPTLNNAQIQPILASVNGVSGAPANGMLLTLSPTLLAFRNTPLTSGVVNQRIVTAAVTLTISSGSTLGMTNAVASHLVLLAIDATSLGGGVELAVCNLSGGNNLDEAALITTVAEGGAGLADSASVFYSTTARANVPFRVVGSIVITEATAGVWATAPTTVQGAGGNAMVASDKILQVVHYDTGASATGTTVMPFDDTIPQNNKGDQYMSLTITPFSATSTLVIDVTYFASLSANSSWITGVLFRDSAASAVGAMSQYEATGLAGHPTTFSVKVPSNAITATTFKLRIGGNTAGTLTFNGAISARYLGGVMASSIRITEIAA